MPTRSRYIAKFDKEVLIDDDHPLARAQDALDAAAQSGAVVTPDKPSSKKKKE